MIIHIIINIYICTKNDYVCTLLVLYVIELADHELYCSAEKYCGRKFHSGKFSGRNFRDFVRKQAFCNLCFDNVFRFLQMNTVTCSLFSSNNGTIYSRIKFRERKILRIAPKGTTIYDNMHHMSPCTHLSIVWTLYSLEHIKVCPVCTW